MRNWRHLRFFLMKNGGTAILVNQILGGLEIGGR
jgi:hypothetical protein